jgi:cytidylate kinase
MRLVTISGLPGSGTSTLCRALAARTGWTYLNTGEVFRQLAQEAGLSLQEYGRRAEANGAIDRQLDERMVELAHQADDGCVLEGRLMGWMVHRRSLWALKVWVHADIQTRARRVSGRDQQTLEKATAAILEREESERRRYARHHDIDLSDTSIYDLVLDSGHAEVDDLRAQVLAALDGTGSKP